MDTYAAQKLATRKFIEHIGQEFLRQNTMDVTTQTETAGELFKMTWTLKRTDTVLEDEENIAREIAVSVNLDSGETTVIRDTEEQC
ncbi:MAG: hypothetical protein Q4C55_09880 [Eubacterium sp.]|nr:hypothetical protein [Eubacterium sp.]